MTKAYAAIDHLKLNLVQKEPTEVHKYYGKFVASLHTGFYITIQKEAQGVSGIIFYLTACYTESK